MKRPLAALALSLAAFGIPTTASAHAPDIRIAGYQFAYSADLEGGGVAGYVSVPLQAPIKIGGTASTDGGAQTGADDGINSIFNTDRVPHTFTECTAACDTAAGSSAGAAFNVQVPPGGAVDFTAAGHQLQAGRLYTFMCYLHPWMRGEIYVN